MLLRFYLLCYELQLKIIQSDEVSKPETPSRVGRLRMELIQKYVRTDYSAEGGFENHLQQELVISWTNHLYCRKHMNLLFHI